MKKKLKKGRDYEVIDGRYVRVFDHIDIPTSERVGVERDKAGRVLEVYIVPARGTDVVAPSPSKAPPSRALGGPPTEPGVASRPNRHRRREAPQ